MPRIFFRSQDFFLINIGFLVIDNFNSDIAEKIHEFFYFTRGKIIRRNSIIYLCIGKFSTSLAYVYNLFKDILFFHGTP